MVLLGNVIKNVIDARGKLPSTQKKVSVDKAQEAVLKKLLLSARNTSFGKEYKFRQILANKNIIEKFQQNVPIFDYDKMYQEWWNKSLEGDTSVSWPGKVKYFALSSGTSGATSKYIPVTAKMVSQIRKSGIRLIWTLDKYNLPPKIFSKGILMLGGSTELENNSIYYEGDLSGITTSKLPLWFQNFYKPGRKISREKDWTKKLDKIVKKAPKWDIAAIVGVPAWLQILLEKIIDHYQLSNIHEIWPNLTIFVHGGVPFSPYVKGFESLLARPLVYIETYLASEGFIAFQSRPNTSSMELIVDNGIFYEFIPFTSENFDNDGNIKNNVKPIDITKVEEDVDYALLISTCSGAWRYMIGDTVKFTSKKNNEIIISGRTQQFLSICGEHLSHQNLNKAIEMLEEELNITVREFAVCGRKSINGMFGHQWFVGCETPVDPVLISETLDKNLKLLNDDYKTERLHAITSVETVILNPSVFYDWLKKQGKEGGQNKFPRVLKDEKLSDWLIFIQDYLK